MLQYQGSSVIGRRSRDESKKTPELLSYFCFEALKITSAVLKGRNVTKIVATSIGYHFWEFSCIFWKFIASTCSYRCCTLMRQHQSW